jgi:diguanylate cyclase (GGDEF)-like protein
VATARVIGPVIGALYLLGGTAVVATLVLPSEGAGPSPVLTVIGPLAMLTGAGLLWWGHRLPRPVFHALVVLGTALITAVVAAAPDVVSALALSGIYTFVAVAAFHLFAPPVALAYLVAAIVAGTVALSLRGVPVGSVIALAVVTATIALVVATLVRRASSASLDGLTGLANRRGFDDALDEAMRVTARSGAQFSVALVDVDHFKEINDQHGHAAGDELLRSVAQDWSSLMPRGALLARHGGDEFAVLLPTRPGPAALEIIEELRRAGSRVAMSAGVAQHLPGESASQLMRRADTALYRAKDSGRGRSALADG